MEKLRVDDFEIEENEWGYVFSTYFDFWEDEVGVTLDLDYNRCNTFRHEFEHPKYPLSLLLFHPFSSSSQTYPCSTLRRIYCCAFWNCNRA